VIRLYKPFTNLKGGEDGKKEEIGQERGDKKRERNERKKKAERHCQKQKNTEAGA